MKKILLLMICRTQGVLDILLSTSYLLFLITILDEIKFESGSEEFVIKFEGKLIGEIAFTTFINASSSVFCSPEIILYADDYIQQNLESFVFLGIATAIAFICIGVIICCCTVITSKFWLRAAAASGIFVSTLLLIMFIIFYSYTFCIFDHAKAPSGVPYMKLAHIALIVQPTIIVIANVLIAFCLLYLDRKNNITPPPMDEQEMLIGIALEKAASPTTSAVFVSSATQNNIMLIKSNGGSSTKPMVDKMPKNQKPKRSKRKSIKPTKVNGDSSKPSDKTRESQNLRRSRSWKTMFRKELENEELENENHPTLT